MGRVEVLAGNQIPAYQQNQADTNQLFNQQTKLKPEIPDCTFKSKSELKSVIISQSYEIAALKQKLSFQGAIQMNHLDFNEVNFNFLVYEVLRLKEEITENLKEINQQKKKIIELQSFQPNEITPLKIAG
jgi:hypothetical protein